MEVVYLYESWDSTSSHPLGKEKGQIPHEKTYKTEELGKLTVAIKGKTKTTVEKGLPHKGQRQR